MKQILITGIKSYIGENFRDFIRSSSYEMNVTEIDMIDSSWHDLDFTKFDTVFHVAGLAHSTPKDSMKELYYKVNRDLAIETAKKAKNSGVKQFIFMSSIIVYGSGEIGKPLVINHDTKASPDNFYGDSKLQAENGLALLNDDSFHVVILRPPMIYGTSSKGNYPKLSQFAKKSLVFPSFKNQRSMLYIKNLCNFISLLIQNNEAGIFLPQNDEYVCTSELVKLIAELNNHKIVFTSIFNPFIIFFKKTIIINKLFGNLIIDQKCSKYSETYCYIGFKQSLIEIENEEKVYNRL